VSEWRRMDDNKIERDFSLCLLLALLLAFLKDKGGVNLDWTNRREFNSIQLRGSSLLN